jgi:hypothetical protein
VAFAEPDYSNYDSNAEQERQKRHSEELKEWLKANGWPGERTGEILDEPHADGYASYMYGDAPGNKACLIHLPYGDAWHSQNVPHLPKKEILARLDRAKKRSALFGSKAISI